VNFKFLVDNHILFSCIWYYFFDILRCLEILYLQNHIRNDKDEWKHNLMKNKSIIFMYLRASKKRRYDENENDMFYLFYHNVSFGFHNLNLS
jgi:hypothetical protein